MGHGAQRGSRALRPVLLALALVLAACSASAPRTGSVVATGRAWGATPAVTEQPSPPVSLAPGRTLQVLQLNLCDSGEAICFTGGRAVTLGEGLMRSLAPDVVTLNEACAADVKRLGAALAAARPRDSVVSRFRPAGDRRSGGDYPCVNGQAYGIGLVAALPRGAGPAVTTGGLYPQGAQDPNDTEERVWLCLRAAGAFTACTTHLVAGIPPVTLAQCRLLFGSLLPAAAAQAPGDPVVLGGDLNVGPPARPATAVCPPPAYSFGNDHGTQFVLTTGGWVVGRVRLVDVHRTTDHPGLLVTVGRPSAG